ncbi:MAG: hypothetical protein ACFCUW_12390 [Kiloniellaceae bacterium]
MRKPNPLYSWAVQAPPPLRWTVGLLLIGGGCLGFLPVLGFWMIPLGVLFLAGGSPRVREAAKAVIRRLRAWVDGFASGRRDRGDGA